jgi:ATP-dependent Clp protease ATP-binding subunit ClpA
MLELKRTLATRLKELGVRIDVPDGDTVLFRDVPINERFYNKARTNLLVKRPQAGMPFMVCVDEDLEYSGGSAELARAFAGSVKQQGWRMLLLGQGSQSDLQETVNGALRLLGFEGNEPALPPPAVALKVIEERGLLTRWGINLTRQAADGKAEPTVGREEEVEEVVSALLRWGQARLPVIQGPSGVGKTNLLHAAAHKLRTCRPDLNLVALDLAAVLSGTLFDAERENLLTALLKEALAAPDTVLALEHLELALAGQGPLLLTQFLDAGARLVGTLLPEHLSRVQWAPFARRLHLVPLSEPTPSETAAVLEALRPRVAEHHRLAIDASYVNACVKAAQPLAGCFPAKAVTLLDAAAARAALAGATELSLDDLYGAAGRWTAIAE